MSTAAPSPPPDPPRGRLSLLTRIALYGVGWLLILVGLAGLVLPGIQGLLTIGLGVAVLSAASEWTHRRLRQLLHRRWPRLWRHVDRFRERLRKRLERQR